MLYYETITRNMKTVAEVIFSNFDSRFYLAGGTALALQIGHRMSVDLDYFLPADFNTQELKQHITDSFPSCSAKILFEEKNTLWCTINDVKVSFITRKDILLKPTRDEDVFRLASVEDITVMKLNAICNRDEFKDYFDLACISKITDVRMWVSWWQKVYEHSDITSWLVALGAIETVSEIPLEIQDKFIEFNVYKTIKTVTAEITNFIRI